ncbi:MAG: F0F1 ATP synthase subunit B [Candidatus Ratteibacteria bacterium]|jgi:F-type H+-transporting ATPase subunit b
MITVDPRLLLAQLITFLVAVFILWKTAWKPLNQMMRLRQEKISSELEEAARAQKETRKMEEDYQQRLKDLNRKTAELLSQTKQEGMKMREEIINQARAEAEEVSRKARLELKSEQDRMLAELRSETTLLSLEIAEKAIQRALDERDREKLFQEILPKMDAFQKDVDKPRGEESSQRGKPS